MEVAKPLSAFPKRPDCQVLGAPASRFNPLPADVEEALWVCIVVGVLCMAMAT